MKFRAEKAKWSEDSDGFWLSLLLPTGKQEAVDLTRETKPLRADISIWRERRSLDANAYYWILLDKLAEKTGIGKEQLYREMIRDIGGNSEIVCVRDIAVAKLVSGWEHNGLGWQTDTLPSRLPGCTNVVLYYGSSTYDTAQMSRLIDRAVQDAKDQGIETMTPAELDRLKALWQAPAGQGA